MMTSSWWLAVSATAAAAALARVWLRRRRLYLGFDFSTQSLTTLIINNELEQVYLHQVSFDRDLPEFGTKNGVHPNHHRQSLHGEVYLPFDMMLRALELSMQSIPPHLVRDVCSISGTAQQHVSVYWTVTGGGGGSEVSLDLDPRLSLRENLFGRAPPPPAGVDIASAKLAQLDCPSWMDSSTTQLCRWLELLVPRQELKRMSGSRACERFTGVQLIKQLAMRRGSSTGSAVDRVTLLSCALTSVLCGRLTPADCADGSGMNLMNLHTQEWSAELCNAHGALVNVDGATLKSMLGPAPVPLDTVAGNVDPYFSLQYGFSPACRVVCFTGDNHSTLFGLGLLPRECAISLGSSTTVLSLTSTYAPHKLEQHTMVLDGNKLFMEMLCFKNGALVRDAFVGEGGWKAFDELIVRGVEKQQRDGRGEDLVAFVFPEVEITPALRYRGVVCFDARSGTKVDYTKLATEDALLALLHGQFLAIASRLGDDSAAAAAPLRVVVTGGGSNSLAMVQVLANCLQLPVQVSAQAHAACLGSAIRAKHLSSRPSAVPTPQSPPHRQFLPQDRARYLTLQRVYPAMEQHVNTLLA